MGAKEIKGLLVNSRVPRKWVHCKDMEPKIKSKYSQK
jgi:hypothetical protein